MATSRRHGALLRTGGAIAFALFAITSLARCSLLTSPREYSRGSGGSSDASDGGREGVPSDAGDASALAFPRVFLLGGPRNTNSIDFERAPFAVWSAGFDPDGRLIDWHEHPYATANSDAWSARLVGSQLALAGAAGDAGLYLIHARVGPDGTDDFLTRKLWPVYPFTPDISLSLPFVWADDQIVTVGGTLSSGGPTLTKRLDTSGLDGPYPDPMPSPLSPDRWREVGPGASEVHQFPTVLAHAGSIYVIGEGSSSIEALRFDGDAGVTDVRSISLGESGRKGACLVGSATTIYAVGGLGVATTVKVIPIGGSAATDGPKLTTSAYWPGCFIHESRLYAVGGGVPSSTTSDGVGPAQAVVQSVRVNADGSLEGPWQESGTLPVEMIRAASVVVAAPAGSDR